MLNIAVRQGIDDPSKSGAHQTMQHTVHIKVSKRLWFAHVAFVYGLFLKNARLFNLVQWYRKEPNKIRFQTRVKTDGKAYSRLTFGYNTGASLPYLTKDEHQKDFHITSTIHNQPPDAQFFFDRCWNLKISWRNVIIWMKLKHNAIWSINCSREKWWNEIICNEVVGVKWKPLWKQYLPQNQNTILLRETPGRLLEMNDAGSKYIEKRPSSKEKKVQRRRRYEYFREFVLCHLKIKT